MSEIQPNSPLQRGEEILRHYKPARKSSLGTSYVIGPILVLGGLLVSLYMGIVGGLMSFVASLFSVSGTPIVIGLGMIAAAEIKVRGSNFYVTNQRVIKDFTFLISRSKVVKYDRITHIAPNQGIIDRIFGAGTVRVKTAGTNRSEFNLKHIQEWREAERDISEAMNQEPVNKQSQGMAGNNTRQNPQNRRNQPRDNNSQPDQSNNRNQRNNNQF